ncbi:MAG: TIGR00159 family protein [Erysipelothrix sp.]|nr:TIGR00159 family protein [Erysipelothrix sp.]
MNWTWIYRLIDVLRVILDIGIVWLILFYLLKIFRSNARTVQIIKGILIVIIVKIFAGILQLSTLNVILDYLLNWGFLAVVIIFQPEIRSLLERVGKTSVLASLSVLSGNERERLISELIDAVNDLSKSKTGALITLEQGQSLEDFIKTGTPLNSIVTKELLTSIFVTSTPLHDGAVIIRGDRIAVASAYFPPTNNELPLRFGARHRAAVGISEITDSITIVVSEETGSISIAQDSKLTLVDISTLRDFLELVIQVSSSSSDDINFLSPQENKDLEKDYTDVSIVDVVKEKQKSKGDTDE